MRLYVAMTLLAACCLLFTPQLVNNYIDWAAVEQYTIYDYKYEFSILHL